MPRWPRRERHGNDRRTTRRQREAVYGYRIFASHGWGDDGSGHFSARDPGHSESFWLLRDGVAFAAATVADLVLVRPDGTVADDGDVAINPAAFCIHGPIHQARPEPTTDCSPSAPRSPRRSASSYWPNVRRRSRSKPALAPGWRPTAAASVRRSLGSASNGDVVFSWLCRTSLADGERAITPEVVAP